MTQQQEQTLSDIRASRNDEGRLDTKFAVIGTIDVHFKASTYSIKQDGSYIKYGK